MSQQTNDQIVEEVIQDPLFMDTFALMTDKFPEVDNGAIAELLIVGVLYERGLITRADGATE
jgi:hypothetical protein